MRATHAACRRSHKSFGLASVLPAASPLFSDIDRQSRTGLADRRRKAVAWIQATGPITESHRGEHYCNYLALCASLGRAIIVNRTAIIREHFVAKKINQSRRVARGKWHHLSQAPASGTCYARNACPRHSGCGGRSGRLRVGQPPVRRGSPPAEGSCRLQQNPGEVSVRAPALQVNFFLFYRDTRGETKRNSYGSYRAPFDACILVSVRSTRA